MDCPQLAAAILTTMADIVLMEQELDAKYQSLQQLMEQYMMQCQMQGAQAVDEEVARIKGHMDAIRKVREQFAETREKLKLLIGGKE